MIKRLLKKGSEQIVKGYEYYRVAIQQEMEDRIRERCKYGYAERQPLLQQQHDILGSSSSDQQSSLGPQYHHDHHHHHQAPPPQSLYYQLTSPLRFHNNKHHCHTSHILHTCHILLIIISLRCPLPLPPPSILPPAPQQLHHQILNSPSLASSTYHHHHPPNSTQFSPINNVQQQQFNFVTTMAALTVH